MPITLDHQLKEYIPHNAVEFPISYFHDELATLPNFAGPLHWHPDFEIATAECVSLDYQVGENHIILEAGDSIFVNRNTIHSIKQLSGGTPDPMPNIVFSGTLVAPETSTIYQKHIQPFAQCDFLPFIVFRHNDSSHTEINSLIKDIYKQMNEKKDCYELTIQRNLNYIFEYISSNFSVLPKVQATRIEINNQIRLQKMLTFIYENYADSVTLEDISKAANISRSEAGRCFRKYMGCSPIEALISYRLQTAHRLLGEKALSLSEISFACGFNSVNYFSRQFKKVYGYTPRQSCDLGK
ncbi:MAG TPA: helix-turn-helix transcriptional regulator [Candidatus Scubalenecus merdavium]|uniref:Helix-turn-helix transcriptional regulator n=1 Tax=Candidatus Scybalenecus merdavium TaxID=2840939 RepID=A0A9D1SNM2_9FIRM|nr:helix-turn-helix transcriptional regulator [Candidatus Scubalenecus merdavium]